ncbi:hypothetical protein [Bacillus sp. FJAT-42376]|uniref:hypothetical protein n=1 Tax=Bacillus sp. FJAT-42376 TaxID=2014076 RepID=UPI000F4FA209|nr:hypothetical protein [Bacillus sp. FJAT-42376]
MGCITKPLASIGMGFIALFGGASIFQADEWQMFLMGAALLLFGVGMLLIIWSDSKAGDWGWALFTASIAAGGTVAASEAFKQDEWAAGIFIGVIALIAAIIIIVLIRGKFTQNT